MDGMGGSPSALLSRPPCHGRTSRAAAMKRSGSGLRPDQPKAAERPELGSCSHLLWQLRSGKSRGATMLTLYDFGNSVCCQKVRITMRAKGLDWESVKVDLFKAEQYDAKYLKLNPKGVVPTLIHDGKPIIESTLICEYLDDTFPVPRLIPSDDPWQRSRMRL